MADSPMPRLPDRVRRLFRFPFRTFARISRDLDDEVGFHLEMRTDELLATGMSPEDARAKALRTFGDADELRDFCRSLERPAVARARVREWLTDLGQDMRFARRQLRKTPGFTLVAVLTLALGIGANTTIYSAVHDLLLAPLPYRDADRLVRFNETLFQGQVRLAPTPTLVDAWRARSRSVEGIVEFSFSEWMLGDGGEPELVRGDEIAPDLTSFLGSRPLLGRTFTAEDARPGATPVVLLNEGLWRRRFGARRDAVGRMIALDGRPFTVVGVMPRDFGVAIFGDLGRRQLFVPLIRTADLRYVDALGRLRGGAMVEEATRELSALAASESAAGAPGGAGAFVISIRDSFSDRYRETLTLLFGAVGLVLLIACANVANLLLVRAWSRQREFAIRTAIGAGRGRLVRQLLTESTALALAGGALGVLLAWRAIPLIAALRPPRMGELGEIQVAPAVLVWSVGLAIVTGILFGLAPALFATERQIGEALKDTARTTAGRAGSRRFRGALVVGEMSLSTVLLIGAGLLVRSLIAREQADAGLYPSGLMSVALQLPAGGYPTPAARAEAFAQIVKRTRAVAGIEAAALAWESPPLSGSRLATLNIEGRAPQSGQKPQLLGYAQVQPDYFRTTGLPLLAGRVFTGDTMEHAVVVSQAFARHFLPAAGALGARIRYGDEGPWLTVVGIVGDVRRPGETGGWWQEWVYEPISASFQSAALVVRARNPSAVLPFVTRFILAMDPAIHIRSARTIDAALAEGRALPRFMMTLLTAFAALALGLASIGLYGVVAYSVRQRTHEIGVRVALGARAEDVLGLVLRQGLGLALLGILIGLAGAAAATRLIRSQLYEVGPGDPATFALVAGVLALVALAASYLPARAALRVDPVEALRTDG